ncbi:MAG TPA: four helix bundle protein [Gemmatimonadaceae bacterium]
MTAAHELECMPDPSKLIVLDKAHLLLEAVNEAVESIRQPHHGELKRQLMKSALSTASNIAEGRRKETQAEFLRFLDIALGSNGELETQLKAAKNCRAISLNAHADLAKRAEEVGRMLSGLKKRIKEDLGHGSE